MKVTAPERPAEVVDFTARLHERVCRLERPVILAAMMAAASAPRAAGRALAEIQADARQANCPQCWQRPGSPCTQVPEGDHVARFGRAMRRGLITGPELIAVLGALDAFTNATVVSISGGAR